MLRNTPMDYIVVAVICACLAAAVYAFAFAQTRVQRNAVLSQIGIQLFLLMVTATVLFPILWIVGIALEPTGTRPRTLDLVPDNASFEAFRSVLIEPWDRRFCTNPLDASSCMTFPKLLWNSVLVALGTSVFSVVLGSSAAYAFSRFKFIGRKWGLLGFVILLMLPATATLATLFVLLSSLPAVRLLGGSEGETLRQTLLGLSVAYASGTLPFAIWNLKGYFDTIPKDLEEAAMIDGASPTQAFLRVILPLSAPAIAVTVLFAFMAGWTEFALAWTFIEKVDRYTLAMALTSMIGDRTTDWAPFAAMSLVMSLPIVLLFFTMQRYIVGGLTAGGVK